MKYLILIKSNPEWAGAFAGFTPEERAEGLSIYMDLVNELVESGEYVDGARLADPLTAVTITSGDAGAVASDGPFAEAKEWFGGYYTVDVDSLERASEIAARLPEASWGGVSVHPTMAASAMDM